jgi:hypothetical protein
MFKLIIILWMNGVAMQDVSWYQTLEDCKYGGDQAVTQNRYLTYVCIPDHKPKYK